MLIERLGRMLMRIGAALVGLESRGVQRQKNLRGDRDIEWSWIEARIPLARGRALDFGCGGSHLGLVAAERGYDVLAIDLQNIEWPYNHPRLRFRRCDVMQLHEKEFDLVLNCSTVEHVGIAGRYGIRRHQPDGDLEAMGKLRELMKQSGTMLLTIPVGRDAIFPPMCRVYGAERLPRLVEGFEIGEERFWKKDDTNRWLQCSRDEAVDFACEMSSHDPLQNVCALGGFVLMKR